MGASVYMYVFLSHLESSEHLSVESLPGFHHREISNYSFPPKTLSVERSYEVLG